MTQDPIGQIILRRDGRDEEQIDPGPPEDLYRHAVQHFNAAVRGDGAPFVTSEDGVRSLAVGLAVLESSRTGCRVQVRYPGAGVQTTSG
jgi:1,5-anhydro-D-fructose reductase (1,5-anhydro-D-mannitol-forming)